MNCLLVAATAKEIGPFLTQHRLEGKQDTDVLISGVGLTATTYALTKQVGLKKPGFIIQAGIAGCFDENIPLGSVVVIKQDCFGDQVVIENKQLKTVFDLDLVSADQFPFTNTMLVNPHKKLLRRAKLRAVNAVSVNQITTGKQTINRYRKKFNPIIESMEGAALHYTCLSEHIPFLQVRSISNYIGERNKRRWNIKDAIINLNREITRLTNLFNNQTSIF